MSQFTATVTPANQFTVSVSPAQSLVTITHQQIAVTVSAVGVQGPQGASGGGGGGGSGDVVGPASSVADRVAVFSGTTGKLLADGGATIAEVRARSSHTGEQAIATVTGLQTALDGKEASGAAAAAVAAHVALGDPHTQYATDAALVAGLAGKEDVGTAAASVAAHVAAVDPHPGYTTPGEAAAAAPVQSVSGRTGDVTLAKADVGLGNVDNTTDAAKPISNATQTALDLKANLASPTLTGTPLAPTAAADTNTTQIATTAFVIQEIGNDTTKAAASHTHVEADVTGLTAALALKAPLASPGLTGTPTVPTAAIGTNTTQAASTAFVQTAITGDVITDSPGSNQNDYNPTGFSTARVVRISPTTSIRLSGLSGGASGRTLTISNVGDGLIIITSEDANSSAANRFALGSMLPIFLFPGDSVVVLYDGTSSRWRRAGGGSAYSQFDEFQEYTGATVSGAPLTTAIASGSAAGVQFGTYGVNNTENALGVIQCDTGTTNAGYAGVGLNSSAGLVPAKGQAMWLGRIAPEQLSTAGEEFALFAGFHDSFAAAQPTDGIYFAYRRATSVNWLYGASQGGTRTEAASSVAVATTFTWLGFYVNASWTRVDFFYSNDQLAWEFMGSNSNSNIPSGTQYCSICCSINKSAGSTQTNLAVDFQGYRYDMFR